MYWREKIYATCAQKSIHLVESKGFFDEHESQVSELAISEDVLRLRQECQGSQDQTKNAFDFKWKKRETYESAQVQKATREWLFKRYFAGDSAAVSELLAGRENFLDAGCGAGHSALLLFGECLSKVHYLGVDISAAVDVARERFVEQGISGEFLQANIMQLPFDGPIFDVIFSEGVLHHTDSTERALKYLAGLLRKGGVFLFYVYNKKGPVREFADDYVRNVLRPLEDEKAWDALLPLTRLGAALGELQIEVDVPEDVPFLGIPKGKIDIQRLFYWYFLKAYYRPDWTVEELNHINFDWYRPSNCWRQTPEDVESWCVESGMKIQRMDVEEAGITVVAEKE